MLWFTRNLVSCNCTAVEKVSSDADDRTSRQLTSPVQGCVLISFLISALHTKNCLLGFPAYFLFLYLFFLTYLLPGWHFPLRIGPLCFQVRSRKRWPNLFFYVVSVWVPDAWLFCVMVTLVICVSLGLLHIFAVVSPGFDFVFSVLVKRLAGRASAKWPIVSSGMQKP